mmetsp:Transcript_23041/g.42447  ORF Transcript_23041/g.42447 Transcript_23041/m.42447 type:complete len:174 (-) Transcript_23041:90-611(-)
MGCTHASAAERSESVIVTVASHSRKKSSVTLPAARPNSRHSTSSNTSFSNRFPSNQLEGVLKVDDVKDFDSMASTPTDGGNSKAPQPPDLELTKRHTLALEKKLQQIQKNPKAFRRAVLLRRMVAFPEGQEPQVPCHSPQDATRPAQPAGPNTGVHVEVEESTRTPRHLRMSL